MIPVTRTYLPPQEEYQDLLRRIWTTQLLTNRGELLLQLEAELRSYLGADHFVVMNNGTVPIQIALHLLADGGEVITTPFSYVATTTAILWEKCTPVFVDIEADHLTIDPDLIEGAINPRTRAILATHVFGNACDVERIEEIAKRHGLYVIYDAAHCFGVKYKGRSIFNYGDISTCSFHATKVFHTAEGGAAFCQNQEMYDRIYFSHNFGHLSPTSFKAVGINGKISELQAAMGLAVLKYQDVIFSERKKIVLAYDERLRSTSLVFMNLRKDLEWNYSYYPVLFPDESTLLEALKRLEEKGVFPRRYFYPSLNLLPYLEHSPCVPVSESISSRVLCLPLFVGLNEEDQDQISNVIASIC
jgi:dTDP-4-amino-4,6-dideoxygalactose transaminase